MRSGNPDPSPETRFGAPNGNTPGRKHTKDSISRAFLRDLHEVWQENGKDVLKRLAAEGDLKANAAFAKITSSLEPKEVETRGPLANMSDEGLQKLIDLAARLESEKKA